jgi:hypothetical protein
VGMAVRRTDSTEEPSVGIPDSRDSMEESEARASDIEAASEGELPESVGELPKSVVNCGMGSASVKAAMPRMIILLRNISTWILLGVRMIVK